MRTVKGRPTRKQAKAVMLSILKTKVKKRHWEIAAELEKDGHSWGSYVSRVHPLNYSTDFRLIQSCKKGCILQKAYVKLIKKFDFGCPEDQIPFDPICDLGSTWQGVFSERWVSQAITMNDLGHFHKLKKFIEKL